ncbi:MAG: U32 family peptidase [Candidatus Marinimicrobia bacterium]|nr:U32 family peptidase [Candidatus Neomarinimicrobiota bacterium]
MQKPDKIEIMAPVGSYAALHAAINANADSVYFGIENLNMRSQSSKNFTISDLNKIVNISQKNSVKSYLTLNTVIYNEDIGLMQEIITAAKKAGINAIIASDLAVMQYARQQGLEIHMSTQANISNIEAVKFYSNFADVVVLARELNLKQVGEITEKIERGEIRGPSGARVRVEMFVHGALCMAISGKCYLSLHQYNRSANRGACLQVCRRAYIVTDKENGKELEIDNENIMSPKDLCTIHFINKILDAGVSVLKIEGRARSPEYVKTVVECYREAVDSYFDGTYNEEKIAQWKDKLKSVFNRGFWDGYYLGQKLGEWTHKYGSQATRKKVYVGPVTNYYDKIQVGEFYSEAASLAKEDNALIIGPTTGVIELDIDEVRIDDEATQNVPQGVAFTIPVEEKLRRSDKLYKIIEKE